MLRLLFRLAKAYALYRIGKMAMRENSPQPARKTQGRRAR